MNELLKTLVAEFSDPEYAHAYLEENANMRIAAQVRALRLQRGWSQSQLADRAKMKQERISKIEMADFDSLTLKTLRRLAKAFDVHLGVSFMAVADALVDFASLSKDALECEQRDESLATLSGQLLPCAPPSATSASFTNGLPLLPTSSRSVAICSL